MGARVQPGGTPRQHLDLQAALLQVVPVDVGDLVLPARRPGQPARHVHHVGAIEVEPRHGEVRRRVLRLLLEADRAAVGVEVDHPVLARIGHPVGEHRAAVEVGEPAQLRTHAGAVEDVVAQDQRDRLVADVVRAQHERLRQPLRGGLLDVAQRDPELAAVAQQPPELPRVLGRGDDEDVADPRQHERRQRVVDHRLVEHWHQLLARGQRQRPQPGAAATGQDDALHRAIPAVTGPSPSGRTSLRPAP